MQDVLSLLSKFVPPNRILKLCFSSGFRFYIFKIPHLCKMRRLFWGGYKNILEGVNLESEWSLIPFIPAEHFLKLKPTDNLAEFVHYIGPYYEEVSISWVVVWSIIRENLGVLEYVAKNCKTLDYFVNIIKPFPIYVKDSPVFSEAMEILARHNSGFLRIFGELKLVYSKYSPKYVDYAYPFFESIEDTNPSCRGDWTNISYLLKYHERGRQIIEYHMQFAKSRSFSIPDQEIFELPLNHIKYLQKFKYKWKIDTYIMLTARILPKKNLPDFVRKYGHIYFDAWCCQTYNVTYDILGAHIKLTKKKARERFKKILKDPQRRFCKITGLNLNPEDFELLANYNRQGRTEFYAPVRNFPRVCDTMKFYGKTYFSHTFRPNIWKNAKHMSIEGLFYSNESLSTFAKILKISTEYKNTMEVLQCFYQKYQTLPYKMWAKRVLFPWQHLILKLQN